MKMEVKIFLVVEGEEGEIEIGIGEFLRSAAILDVLEWVISQESELSSLDPDDLLFGERESIEPLVCPSLAQVTTISSKFQRKALKRELIEMKVYVPDSSLFFRIRSKRGSKSPPSTPPSTPPPSVPPSPSSSSSSPSPVFSCSSPPANLPSSRSSPSKRREKQKRKVRTTGSATVLKTGSSETSKDGDGDNTAPPSIGPFIATTSSSKLKPPKASSSGRTSPRKLSNVSSFSSYSRRKEKEKESRSPQYQQQQQHQLDLGEDEDEELEEEEDEDLTHLLREKAEESHDFRLVTFHRPTHCEICKEFIWGLKNQGYKCRSCGHKVHRGCRKTAPECEGKLKRTSSFTPDMSRVQQLVDYASTDMGGLTKNLSNLSTVDLDALVADYPLYHRTSVEIDLNKYKEPLACYHDLFNIPSPLQEIERLQDVLKSGQSSSFSASVQVSQKTKEIQDIVSFRCQISSMFSKFNPEEIPEMTASFFPRETTLGDQAKVINVHFFFGETQFSGKLTSKLRLCDPLRIAVKKAISVAGDSCPVQSVDDAVLRRVGRKEYIWQLENALVCYDFAIEAYEKRGLLKFFVSSKKKMTEEGVVFDEDAEFEKGARDRLSHVLENFWLPDDAAVEAVNERYGMDLARRERVHNSKDIDKILSIQIRSILNFRELERTLIPDKWKTEEDILVLHHSPQMVYESHERSWVFFVEVLISYGDNALTPRLYTIPMRTTSWPSDEATNTITTELTYKDIPPQSRVCLTLFAALPKTKGENRKFAELFFGKEDDGKDCIIIGSVALSITEYNGHFRQGEQHVALWPKIAANPADSVLSNPDPKAMKLSLEFPTFKKPVVVFNKIDSKRVEKNKRISEQSLPVFKRKQLEALLDWDVLGGSKEGTAKKIWKNRFSAREMFPECLAKVILSAPKEEEDEIRELVDPELGLQPCNIPPSVALELLDYKFGNKYVRRFAVQCLAKCSDSEILLWMLQLVQALKYEPRHYSCLSYFLIYKALHSKKLGFSFFWMLVAEISSSKEQGSGDGLYLTPSSSQRFLLYIDAYLNFCGEDIKKSLIDQLKLMDKFSEIAEGIQQQKSTGSFDQLKKERNVSLREHLSRVKFPGLFSLPTDSDLQLASVEVNKCKVMVSAAAPLWLTFSSEEIDASPCYVIFKKGDDLRKDILSLQMFRLFDHIWKQGNLDLRMTPYQVVMTGRETGLVQVVTNSRTCADIQKEEAGVRGAFKSTGLLRWLEEKNPTKGNLEQAIENFIRSCAGYCVATYVLGVGDRHNDNIMVTETGLFFHIDFGYILGDFLKFGIIDRETAPFILTKEFVRVMGGEDSKGFKRFSNLCIKAYLLLRENNNLIISLFTMMLGCGIPGVSRFEDLYFLRTSLALDMSKKEAQSYFMKLIEKSLRCIRTQFNFAAHILAN